MILMVSVQGLMSVMIKPLLHYFKQMPEQASHRFIPECENSLLMTHIAML